MSYSDEHRRFKPVLDLARRLDIATNPEPGAIFEAGNGGFQIWCTPQDHPAGWEGVRMTAGAFSKPCAFVASVHWGWEEHSGLAPAITHLCIETDAYDLHTADRQPRRIHNRPADLRWAKAKVRGLFRQAGVPCPPIRVEPS